MRENLFYHISKHLETSQTYVGGGAHLTKFNTGRLRPEVQPLTLLYTILVEKQPLLLKKVPLSHTYL